MAEYGSLRTVLEEVRQAVVDDRTAQIVDCPRCGILLNVRDGVYDCPLGHFTTRNPFRHATVVR